MIKSNFNILIILFIGFLLIVGCINNEQKSENTTVQKTPFSSAKVTGLKGNALFKSSNTSNWEVIQKDQEIPVGSEVVTDFNSEMELTLVDKSKITVSSLTYFKINEVDLPAPGASSKNKVKLNLNLGKINANVSKSAGGFKSFQVSTPNGVASVRGTIETVTYYPDKGMSVFVEQGLVSFDGINRSVLVNAGNSATMSKGAPTSSFKNKAQSKQIEAAKDNSSIDLLDNVGTKSIIDKEKL